MKTIYRNENSIIFKNEFQNFTTGDLLSPIETQNYTVIQVADSYYGGRFLIPEHKQYCDIEITLPLSGVLICSADGEPSKVAKQEVYLSYKGEMHELQSNKGSRFQTLAINVKGSESLELLESVKRNVGDKRLCKPDGISSLLTEIVAEFVSDMPFSENCLDGLITSVLVKLARVGITPSCMDIISAEETLPAIVNYIDSHFSDILSLEELSSKFGYSYSHICKKFRGRYGIAPSEYLLSKKMDLASALLESGKSVSEISDTLGYSSPYNFSRAFKKHFGTSPTKYKA